MREAARLEPPAGLPTPADFQVRSIVSLVLAEVACILGFVQSYFFHAPLMDYVPFGVAAVLVIALDIIPLGLEYWKVVDAQARGQQAARPIS